MDDIDRASTIEEQMRALRIYEITSSPPAAKPTGFCLECDDPVPSGHRWCGPECRDAWARMADA